MPKIKPPSAHRDRSVTLAAPRPTVEGMAPHQNPAGDPQDDTEPYVGLPVEEARRRAGERGWTTVRTLPPDAVITMEYVAARLNFTVRDDRVARCWKG